MEKQKRDKKEEEREKKEKEREILNQKKLEVETMLKEFNSKRFGIKITTYIPFLETALSYWNFKTKDSEYWEILTNTIIIILEAGVKESELANFQDKLISENKVTLMKVLYSIYSKISEKKDCKGLRANKLLAIHNKLIESEGKGGVANSIFSTQK